MATSIVTARRAHKNKTLATLLALLFGALGVQRFYLRGAVDKLGLLHVMTVPLSGMIIGMAPDANPFYQVLPLIVSAIAGFLEALVIGLLADDKFDLAFNPGSGGKTESQWPLALLLVATMLVGATVTIATISRLFDLLYTGGAYG